MEPRRFSFILLLTGPKQIAAAQFFGAAMAQRGWREEQAAKNPTVWQKIIDHVREFLKEVRDLLEKTYGRDLAVKTALQTDIDLLDQFCTSFQASLDQLSGEQAEEQAEKPRRGVEISGENSILDEDTENGTENVVKYSLTTDSNENPIDRYTEKKYNDYGWINVNNVLTGKELKKLYSQFAEIELLKSRYAKTPDGYYMIPVGDNYDSYNKIVFIKGTNKHPLIQKVYEFTAQNYTENEISEYITGVIDYENRGISQAFRTFEKFAGEELFIQRTLQDYNSYWEQRNAANRTKSYRDRGERKNGKRSGGTDTETIKESRVLDDYIEEIDPREIEPINEITEEDRYDYLVDSFKTSGWDGRPIVVVENGNNGYIALTGSHRIYAALEADIPVKTIVLPYSEDIEELVDARDDIQRANIAESLAANNVIPTYAADLIVREEELNDENYDVPYEKQRKFSRVLDDEYMEVVESGDEEKQADKPHAPFRKKALPRRRLQEAAAVIYCFFGINPA